jgi:hypothetical protein
MKKCLTLCSGLAFAALASSSLWATTATSLGSFGGIEEPATIYHPSTSTFTSDSFVNITDQGSGTFRMFLRYRDGSWWDGDRTTTSDDRQRAEVKVLGNRQGRGETYEYRSTWRLDSAFSVGSRFCHITQVKAYDGGDTGDPLVTTSVIDNTNAAVRYCSAGMSGLTTVRSFSWAPNTSKTVAYRLTTSSANGTSDGALTVSVNGDSFTGITNHQMYRVDATQYQPKWGLYRGVQNGMPFGDDYSEHSNVQANKITSTTPPTVSMEAESLSRTSSGATTSLQSDANSSGGTWVQLDSTDNAGDYVEYTTTSLPAGTYSVRMMWKGNTGRGILTLKVDGAQVGGTLDQYSSTQTYPTTTFGNVTFSSSGTHKVRLTVAGKNGSSSTYALSADKFTFVGQ